MIDRGRLTTLESDRPVTAVCWVALDEDQIQPELDKLRSWVEWVVDRYSLDHRTVPPCWAEHGALIEELSALHTAWQAAFTFAARGEAPLDWHHAFASALQRITLTVSRAGCRSDEHRGGPPRLYAEKPACAHHTP